MCINYICIKNGEVMKRCINPIVAIIVLSLGFNAVGSSSDQSYTIVPTTVGDNSIVKAIQHYSNITESYVNKWRPFGLWIIGPSLRSGVVDSINNYIRVCKSLKLAHYRFSDEESLRAAFPINWTVGALCAALKNLKEQGMNALALIAQVGSDEVKRLDAIITSYLSIIDHNRNVLKATCTELMKKRREKKEELMKGVLAQATIKEKQWKNATAQVKIVDDIKKVADFVQSGVPTALLGVGLYLLNKTGVFDTYNPVAE